MEKLKESKTNEQILAELDNICGAEKCKEVLESYAMYLTLKKEKKMDFGTCNIMIKNPIESETSKQIIEVIWKLLKANNVISTKYRYLNEDEVREDRKKESKKENKKTEKNTKNKKVKEIKEDMLIIDSKELGGRLYGTEKNTEKKITPALVPYSELPESEKDYDRNTALDTLKLIVKLGYEIKCKRN